MLQTFPMEAVNMLIPPAKNGSNQDGVLRAYSQVLMIWASKVDNVAKTIIVTSNGSNRVWYCTYFKMAQSIVILDGLITEVAPLVQHLAFGLGEGSLWGK